MISPQVGFEPTTNRLTAERSTPELLRILFPSLFMITTNTNFCLEQISKAGDAIRTRDINLGKVALYP